MRDVQQPRTNVLNLCRSLLVAFGAMSVCLAWWHTVRAPALRTDRYNPRVTERVKITRPGALTTADNVAVLTARQTRGQWIVACPAPQTYCHLTGYSPRSGLRHGLRSALYALGPYEDAWTNILRGPPTGCDIKLTVYSAPQRLATRLMQGKCGAVLALDPRNGAIRAMVSAPAYDPNEAARDYASLAEQVDQPELNRALLGQYAPGSILKLLTAAAAIDTGIAGPEEQFRCPAQVRIGNTTVRCRRAQGHGKISFEEALVDSCNVIFAEVGRMLGPETFRHYTKRFHILSPPELPLPVRGGKMADMSGPHAQEELAEAAFGQGATLISPLAMAQMTAAIAAGGSVPKPKLVDSVLSARGRQLYTLRPESLGQAVSSHTAAAVGGMMVQVVERGTARSARIAGTKVAGKTGSAQNPSGVAHAWFVGFAPADAPRVAVAVIVEHGGAGGRVAAPIARQVMQSVIEADRN